MDLPFRLVVSAVVVGITVPAVHGGLSAYETQQASVRAQQAIESIVRVAQVFYVAGGGAEEIRVDLAGGVTAKVEHVALGDRVGGPRAPSAAYKVTGQRETFLLSQPPVPMAGPDGPFRLGPGVHVVRVSYEGDGPVRLALR